MLRPRNHAPTSQSLQWVCHQCRQHLKPTYPTPQIRIASTLNKPNDPRKGHRTTPPIARHNLIKWQNGSVRRNTSTASPIKGQSSEASHKDKTKKSRRSGRRAKTKVADDSSEVIKKKKTRRRKTKASSGKVSPEQEVETKASSEKESSKKGKKTEISSEEKSPSKQGKKTKALSEKGKDVTDTGQDVNDHTIANDSRSTLDPSLTKNLDPGFLKLLRKVLEEQQAATSSTKQVDEGGSEDEVPRFTSLGAALKAIKPSKGKHTRERSKQSYLDYDPSKIDDASRKTIETFGLELTPLAIEQPPVPTLQYGLDRVLFNPGVYQLQDPHSRVYNFSPYLQKLMPVADFNFDSLKEYKTSSHDTVLGNIARQHEKKYIGSTSSMTSTLAHFHFLLSNWRELNISMISRGMPKLSADFTRINRAPNAIFLRWQNGVYAIDADKEHDSPNVLMMLGKSMELLLTQPTHTYERYRKDTHDAITFEEKNTPEAYHYTTMGDFLMRSQLDAYDPRLPGTGMFDLKTRAVVSVRMNVERYEEMAGYEILTLQGNFESYEREYYDMLRSTMLKYMLQVRMGRMDGIFVAYHNVNRVFGFQYLPLSEIDKGLHGQTDRTLGDQEFKASVALLNEVLDLATNKFPNTSIRLHFETKPANAGESAHMIVFAEPMDEEQIEDIQSTSKAKIDRYETQVMAIKRHAMELSYISDTDNSTLSDEEAKDVVAATARATKADIGYLKSLAQKRNEEEKNAGPLMMAVVHVKNLVRAAGDPAAEWKACEGNRPTRLRADEEWKISYVVEEVDDDDALKWARYWDTKDRRREVLSKTVEEETDSGAEEDETTSSAKGKSGKKDPYIDFLKRLSEHGRKYRARRDEMDKGIDPVSI